MHTILNTSQLEVRPSQSSFSKSVGGSNKSLEGTVSGVLFHKHPLAHLLNDLGFRNVRPIDGYLNLEGRCKIFIIKFILLSKVFAEFPEASCDFDLIKSIITIFIHDFDKLLLVQDLPVTILPEDLVKSFASRVE